MKWYCNWIKPIVILKCEQDFLPNKPEFSSKILPQVGVLKLESTTHNTESLFKREIRRSQPERAIGPRGPGRHVFKSVSGVFDSGGPQPPDSTGPLAL